MLLLDQGTMDKEAVEDLFDISSEQLACVNGAEPGMGLIRFRIRYSNEMELNINYSHGNMIFTLQMDLFPFDVYVVI